ncbi:MAG: immunoglobulin domain-containing protein, partial [Limisphaerales bacterium]
MEKIVSLICLLLVTHSLRAGTPPSISPPLADQQVALAGSAMLSVSATGDAPLSYQWSLNGANLTSGTTSSYSLSYVQAADLGTYSIVVSNPYGSATNNAVLSAACTASPSGIIAWWPGETSAADYAGGFDAAQHSGVSNVPGKVNNCFYFDGSTDAFVDLGTTVGKFATNDFSVEFWEKVPSGTTNQCFIGNDPNSLWSLQSWQVNLGLWGASSPGSLAFFLDNDTQGFAYLSASRNVADGTWHHIACTRSNGGGAVVIAMYIDGTLETNTTASIISVNQPTWPVRLGNDQWYHTYLTNSYMDEVALYNRALSSNDVFAIYTAGTNGKCCANPVITAQPSNPQNIQNGSTAAFSVAVVGTPPLYYQWSNHTSGLISGATSSTFTIGSVGSGDRGTYSVYVWNNCETTNSTDAFLAFAPTNLSVSPAIQTNSYGNSFSFSVTASGDGPFSYQWWHLTSLVGTSSSYSSTVGYGDGGSYVVVVNNNGGTATSSGILYVPPHIVTQPNSRTAACNGSTNFSVVATGGSANQYQWFSSNSGLLAGKTASTLSINPVQALSSGIESYQVVVSNAYGPSVTSTWASLSVAPAITTQPANATACDGSTNTFIGAACGTQTLSYQWCYNGSSVSGATTTSLPVTCSLTTAGSYTLVVTNTAGSATSSPVTLFDMTPSVSQPMVDTNITVIQNNTITLISAGNLYPQWYSNGIAISGATNANLQLINVQPSYAASYNVVYSGSNSCGTPVTSSNITLFVTSASCTNLTNGMAGWWR